MVGPITSFSEKLHATKYRGEGESFREAMNRVASALKDSDRHYHEFREILTSMRFMPGGRVQGAMGSTKNVTPYNCFVSGTIEDSFVAGNGSIMQRAAEAAATMRMGGGIGYDFSTLRPRGAMIKKLQARSTGPVEFMEIFNSVCKCIASSGHRRGAQMGVLRVDHPDIEEFVRSKQNHHRFKQFNISLAVTDEFMRAVEEGAPFDLRFGGEVYKTIDAQALWEMVMRSTWDWADPGVLFIDRINEMNNLYYCETIAATNPCGEQPLPPHGACLLGSFNLVQYLTKQRDGYSLDFDRLEADIPAVVRAMDNVVDRAIYPLYEQEKEAKSKRRMGLGVAGLANAIEAVVGGPCYGDPVFVEMEREILSRLRELTYQASAILAAEKGTFGLYDRKKYLEGRFVAGLNEETRGLISRYGIRNSHLTSIAPTGTISLCADNISSGIEPVFEYVCDRAVSDFEGTRIVPVEDYGRRYLGVAGRVSSDVTVGQHMEVIKAAVPYMDSAISKTCNVPEDCPWDDFKSVYAQAWRAGAKGCTTYRKGGEREAMMKAREPDEPMPAAACYVDPATGRKECE